MGDPTAPFSHPEDPLSDFEVDILGQLPNLKIYTQICHCCRLPAGEDASDVKAGVLSTLEKGLSRLAEAFPWTAGKVVQTAPGEDGTPGPVFIRPHQATPPLVVKDLTEAGGDDSTRLTWQALEEADFPISMLHEDVIAPRTTLPLPTGDPAIDNTWPTLLIQATFIEGGLILCFLAHHQVMDMVGQAQVVTWLSKACEGPDSDGKIFSDDELRIGNRDRRGLVPFLTDEEFENLGPEVMGQSTFKTTAKSEDKGEIMFTSASAQHPPSPPSPLAWTSFTFSASSLADLKAEAMKNLPEGSTSFVSTDDTLTSFIWTTVARARSSRLTGDRDPANIQVPIARAVDARQYFSVPKTYPGLIQNMTYSSIPMSLCLNPSAGNEGLGTGAAALRREISPATTTLGIRCRAMATHIKDPSKDSGQLSMTANLDTVAGIMLSSWASTNAYELEFGLGLGGPRSVRRPAFTPVESLVYLLPKTREGDITAALGLREDDIEALKEDELMRKFARFVG